MSRALPGLLDEKDGSLYYIGNGVAFLGGPSPSRRIIADGAGVYYLFADDSHTAYDAVSVNALDRMARLLKEYHARMSGRATNIELAKWCSTGHGMWKFNGKDLCSARFDPILGEMNRPVSPDIRIWPWDAGHWMEPTRENMGITKEKD